MSNRLPCTDVTARHVAPTPLPTEIAAALEEIADQWAAHGSDLRISDVVAMTGIPRSTLYYHFSGRKDLLAYLATTVIASSRDIVLVASTGPGSEVEKLGRVLEAQVRFFASRPHLAVTLFTNLGSAGDLRSLAERMNAAFHRPVERLLVAGRRAGHFRHVVSPETTASALFGAVAMAAIHYLVVDGHLDAERLIPELVPNLLRGLG